MADGNLTSLAFPFSGGMTADISDRILQLPLLKRIENCRYVRSGGLVSANLFHTFGSPPVTTGGIFRILNHNEELFTLGASNTGLTGVLKYSECEKKWKGVNGYSGCNIRMWDVAQRERDLREVSICAWNDYLYVFYAEPSEGGGRILYKTFCFKENREEPEVSIERECLSYSGEITGLFANNPTLDYPTPQDCPQILNRIIVVVSTTELTYFNFYDPSSDGSFNYDRRAPANVYRYGSQRNENTGLKSLAYFFLYRNTLFYKHSMTSDGRLLPTGNILSASIDGDPVVASANYPGGAETGFNYPYNEAESFGLNRLFDFREWTSFNSGGRDFKVLWTPQTGFWIINDFNEITGHFLADTVPFGFDNANNMRSMIHPAKLEINSQERVFFPVLKSGQPEQIGPRVEYPLGVSLVEIDFNWRNRQDRLTGIGKQGLLTGSALRYFNGIDLVEYGFSEKPKITKTESEDYDIWPYGDLLERRLPTLGQLAPEQFSLFDTLIEKTSSPFTIVDNTLTASFGDADTTQGGTWKNDVAANRALRYSTDLTDGTADKTYSGVLSRVYYNTTDNVLIVEFTGAPATLDSGFTHPRGILINDNVYEFMDTERSSTGVLTCRHFIDSNPFTSGEDYIIRIPSTEELSSPDSLDAVVRTSQTSPARKEIRCVNTSFRRFERRSVRETRGIQSLSTTANVQFGVFKQVPGTRRELVSARVPEVPPVLSTFSLTISRISAFNDLWYRENQITNWMGGDGIHIVYYDPSRRLYARNRFVGEFDDIFQTFYYFDTRNINGVRPLFLGRRLIFRFPTAPYGRVYAAHTDTAQFRYRNVNIQANLSAAFMINLDIWYKVGSQWWRLPNNGIAVRATGASIATASHYAVSGNNVYVITSTLTTMRWQGWRIEGNNIVSLGGGNISGVSDFLRNYRVRGVAGANTALLTKRRGDDVGLSAPVSFSIRNAGEVITPGVPAVPAVYRTVPAQVDGPEGWYKEGYRSRLNLPSDFAEVGSATSTTIIPGVELSGIYTDSDDNTPGTNLYIYFSSDDARFSTPSELDNALRAEPASQITRIRFSAGTNQYLFNVSTLQNIDIARYTVTGTKSVRWNLKDALAASPILKSVIRSALGGSSLSITFQREAGSLYYDTRTLIRPHIFNAVFRTDDALDPDNVSTDVISNDMIAHDPVDDAIRTNFRIPARSQYKIKGPDSSKHYYYKKTTDDPLSFNPTLFSFSSPPNSLSFRYVLVDTAVRAEDLLRARVYKYKTRYKYLDSLGIEHRSVASDEITILANSDFGEGDNRPSFDINKLHLSDKNDDSVTLEVYRTLKNTNTFRLVGELPNQKTIGGGTQRFVDFVKDEDLGQVEGPSNTTIAGANHSVYYKGRYVLYGFPEKPNRLIVSSPIREFVNEVISFKLDGNPQDFIEILMEEDIQCIRALDQYIIIFTKDRVFSWAVNETTASQPYPTEITGFKEITAINAFSITETQNGIMFLTNKGFWHISRGLAPSFIGKDIQDFDGKGGKVLDTLKVRNTEESFISTTDPKYPLINYNHRFGKFSVLRRFNILSMTNWKGKWVGVDDRSKVIQDFTPTDLQFQNAIREGKTLDQNLILETGWVNVSQIQHYQRVTEIYLLAKFERLRTLTYELFVNFNESATRDSNGEKRRPILGVPDWKTKSQWVLDMGQYRQSSAIKVRIHAQAASGEFDALLLNYRVSHGVYLKNDPLNVAIAQSP